MLEQSSAMLDGPWPELHGQGHQTTRNKHSPTTGNLSNQITTGRTRRSRTHGDQQKVKVQPAAASQLRPRTKHIRFKSVPTSERGKPIELCNGCLEHATAMPRLDIPDQQFSGNREKDSSESCAPSLSFYQA